MFDWKWSYCCEVSAGENTVLIEIAGILIEAERTVRYWFTGNKEMEREESHVVSSRTTNRYLRMSLLKAAFGNLFEIFKRCSRINMKIIFGDSLELCCFPVISSHSCGIPEEKDVSSVKHWFPLRKPCVHCLASLACREWLRMARFRTIQETELA